MESLRGKLTQKQFAKLLGVPLTSYTNWVAGISTPKAEAIVLICTKLGVSSDWLLGLTDKQQASGTNELKVAALKGAIQAILDKF